MAGVQVVIFGAEMGLASAEGGGGTSPLRVSRLFSVCEGQLPECMVPVCGRPLLHYQLKLLSLCGLSDVVIVAHEWCEEKIIKCVDAFVKSEISNRNIRAEVAKVPLHFCAVDALLLLKPKLKSDFIIMNWDVLLEPSLLNSVIDFHRVHSAVLTSLLYQTTVHPQVDAKGKVQKPAAGFSFDSLKFPFRSLAPATKHYFALDGPRILSTIPYEAAEEEERLKIVLSKALLRRFPRVSVHRGLTDCTLYICNPDVLTFIEENSESMPR